MAKSFLCALAGWLVGVISFVTQVGRPDVIVFLIAATYSALVVWLFMLWPLYRWVPRHSLFWRPWLCVPCGAVAGALLFLLVYRLLVTVPASLALTGACAGAAACALGSTLLRPAAGT